MSYNNKKEEHLSGIHKYNVDLAVNLIIASSVIMMLFGIMFRERHGTLGYVIAFPIVGFFGIYYLVYKNR